MLAVKNDEARAIPLSRAQDDRRGGRNPRRGCGRRRPRARRRPEPGADHGVSPGAPGASRGHQRSDGARAPGVESDKNLGDKLAIGACVRHAGVPQAGGGRAARRAPVEGRAPYRALSHPHPRHVLRQHRARRSGLGMVPGCGGARRRDGGKECNGHAHHPGSGFFPRHHDHGARRRTSF